jgi:hypothetical protein
MTPWTDREIERFTKRVGLFVRRGAARAAAERIADRLAQRDQERDERRMCVECEHFQRDGGCFAGKTFSADPLAPLRNPIPELLQRCSGFAWQTP